MIDTDGSTSATGAVGVPQHHRFVQHQRMARQTWAVTQDDQRASDSTACQRQRDFFRKQFFEALAAQAEKRKSACSVA
jgi:hypothetical protein